MGEPFVPTREEVYAERFNLLEKRMERFDRDMWDLKYPTASPSLSLLDLICYALIGAGIGLLIATLFDPQPTRLS